jgi:hypothetical protein
MMDVDAVWLQNTMNDVFPQFWSVIGKKDRFLRMCLGSLIHHCVEVTAFAPSHIVQQHIPIFWDPSIIAGIIKKVKVLFMYGSPESNTLLEYIPTM